MEMVSSVGRDFRTIALLYHRHVWLQNFASQIPRNIAI